MGNLVNKMMSVMGLGEEENVQDTDTPVYEPRVRTEETTTAKKGKVVNIHTTTQLKVVVLQPTSYNDSQDIADHLKSKKPVVVNLERLDKEDARKMVDFLSGAVYALDGSMQKVANGILLLAPYNVGIMGDFSSELKSNGIFDLD
ncbi:MAG: cell division protein SepF [Ruminococcaceae bacterium]|nr:cell division protein SepF [Oscillospiraceae bacterium]